MLHVCGAKFDMTKNLEKIWKLNEALVHKSLVTLNLVAHAVSIKYR